MGKSRWICPRKCATGEAGGDLRFLKTSVSLRVSALLQICGSGCKLSVVPAAMSLLHHHRLYPSKTMSPKLNVSLIFDFGHGIFITAMEKTLRQGSIKLFFFLFG